MLNRLVLHLDAMTWISNDPVITVMWDQFLITCLCFHFMPNFSFFHLLYSYFSFDVSLSLLSLQSFSLLPPPRYLCFILPLRILSFQAIEFSLKPLTSSLPIIPLSLCTSLLPSHRPLPFQFIFTLQSLLAVVLLSLQIPSLSSSGSRNPQCQVLRATRRFSCHHQQLSATPYFSRKQ